MVIYRTIDGVYHVGTQKKPITDIEINKIERSWVMPNEKVKNIVNVPDKWKSKWLLSFIYWFCHWFAVQCVAIKHYKTIFPFHDIEKPFKLLIFYPYKYVVEEHLEKPHHKPKTERDIIESICDWQASGYTKKDSPLNAVATLFTYHTERADKYMPLLEKGKFI